MSSDRRDFLKFLFGGTAMGMTLSPLELLIRGAISQSQNEAMAQSTLQKFYFNLSFRAAPDRATYDLFLDPYSATGNNVIESAGFATCYGSSNGNRFDEAIYKTFKVPGHNIHAPWMWGQKMPTSDGFKNIYDLMENMLVIQGVRTASPGHPMSQVKSEEGNGITMAGMLSDYTDSPLNTIQMNSTYTFQSAKGKMSAPLADSMTRNVINDLMAKFNKNQVVTFSNLKDELSESFKNAVDNMNYDSGVRSPSTLTMKNTYDGAIELVASSAQDFATVWADKLAKYKNVTELACTDKDNFNGFLDKPIGKLTARNNQYSVSSTEQCFNQDLRDIITKDTCVAMSSVFAVAEFIANSKYAVALNTRIPTPMTMLQTTESGSSSRQTITNDQHNTGIMLRTLTNALMYRSVSSCLYEFRKFLKTESAGFNFDQTVIRLNGDFCRSPRADGFGADHGWQASNTVLISGMVEAPLIVGRIYKDGMAHGIHGANYKGSWGVGAPVTINGVTAVLTQGNVLSSIASMLGVPSPANNSPSLLRLSNSKVQLADPSLKLKVVA